MTDLASNREFIIKEKFFSMHDRNFIFDPREQQIGYYLKKLWTFFATYTLHDITGKARIAVQQKFSFLTSFKFFAPGPGDELLDENCLGILQKKFTFFKDQYVFETLAGERVFDILGNFLGLEFKIIRDNAEIAAISRNYWAIPDTFGVKIKPDVNDDDVLLILACIVVLHHVQDERR